MFARLLPRSAPYFDYFDRQNAILQEMSRMLLEVAIAPERGDPETELQVNAMGTLEREADDLQHTIVHELSQTFITPIDREDIHAVCMGQEKVIDSLKNLALRFFLYGHLRLRFPAQKMLENLPLIAVEAGHILTCLRKNENASEHVQTVQNIKEDCEMFLSVGLSELYDLSDFTPENVRQLMGWAQLYERIEHVEELFSDLIDTLEQVVLKYA